MDEEEFEALRRRRPELVAAVNELMRVSASLRPHDAAALKSAFDTLAALIEGSPESAQGYLALSLLLAMPHSIGKVEGKTETAWEYTKGRGYAGGKKSGEVREKRPWWPHAEELKQQIINEGEYSTPPKIAEEIRERWKLSLDGRPSVDTLARWIRETGMNRVQSRDEPGSSPRAED